MFTRIPKCPIPRVSKMLLKEADFAHEDAFKVPPVVFCVRLSVFSLESSLCMRCLVVCDLNVVVGVKVSIQQIFIPARLSGYLCTPDCGGPLVPKSKKQSEKNKSPATQDGQQNVKFVSWYFVFSHIFPIATERYSIAGKHGKIATKFETKRFFLSCCALPDECETPHV